MTIEEAKKYIAGELERGVRQNIDAELRPWMRDACPAATEHWGLVQQRIALDGPNPQGRASRPRSGCSGAVGGSKTGGTSERSTTGRNKSGLNAPSTPVCKANFDDPAGGEANPLVDAGPRSCYWKSGLDDKWSIYTRRTMEDS